MSAAQYYCATCRGPLTQYISDTGAVSFEHVAADLRERYVSGHPPAPMPAAEMLHLATYCDFCSEPQPGWSITFAAAAGYLSITQGSIPKVEDLGSHWLACAPCMELVGAGDSAALVRHVVARFRGRGVEVTAKAEAELSQLYTALLAVGLSSSRPTHAGDPLGLRQSGRP